MVSVFSAELGSTADTCGASVWFPGYDFMFVSVFSALLGSIMDTCTALVYEASAVSVDGRPAAAMVSQMSWITSSSGDGYLAASSFSVSCVLGSVAQGFEP